jgi:hypothetical protein
MIARPKTGPSGLLVFDLDGTLIDSETDLVLSVNATLRQMNRPPLPRQQIASYVGRGVPTLMRRALGETASDLQVEQGVEIFLRTYRAHMLDHTVTYPGVRRSPNCDPTGWASSPTSRASSAGGFLPASASTTISSSSTAATALRGKSLIPWAS